MRFRYNVCLPHIRVVADGGSYCVDYCQFAPFGTELVSGLYCSETICVESVSCPSMSDSPKTRRQLEVFVPVLSVPGLESPIPHLIVVPRLIPPRLDGRLAASRRSTLHSYVICAYTLLPQPRIFHHLPRRAPRSHPSSLYRNVPLRPSSSPPSPF